MRVNDIKLLIMILILAVRAFEQQDRSLGALDWSRDIRAQHCLALDDATDTLIVAVARVGKPCEYETIKKTI